MNVGSVAGTGTHEETAEVVVAGPSVLEWVTVLRVIVFRVRMSDREDATAGDNSCGKDTTTGNHASWEDAAGNDDASGEHVTGKGDASWEYTARDYSCGEDPGGNDSSWVRATGAEWIGGLRGQA